MAISHDPPPEVFWIVGYQSLLALGAVCSVQVLALTLAGKPAWTLGTRGLSRLAMTSALLTVVLDLFLALRLLACDRGWYL